MKDARWEIDDVAVGGIMELFVRASPRTIVEHQQLSSHSESIVRFTHDLRLDIRTLALT